MEAYVGGTISRMRTRESRKAGKSHEYKMDCCCSETRKNNLSEPILPFTFTNTERYIRRREGRKAGEIITPDE